MVASALRMRNWIFDRKAFRLSRYVQVVVRRQERESPKAVGNSHVVRFECTSKLHGIISAKSVPLGKPASQVNQRLGEVEPDVFVPQVNLKIQ